MIRQSDISRKINHIMAAVSDDTLHNGKEWYTNAHSEVESMSFRYGLTVQSIAGIVAVLSPGVRWRQNLRDAEHVIQYQEQATVSTYPQNKIKALKILSGYDPFAVIGGPKVTAFFINILDPKDENYVTIDRWILRALGIIGVREQKRVFDSEKQYNFIADVIRRKAKDNDMLPSQLQAVIWEHEREAL